MKTVLAGVIGGVAGFAIILSLINGETITGCLFILIYLLYWAVILEIEDK